MLVFSFCFFLLLFIAIGLFSTFKSKNTQEDYLLAGQDMPPWLVAISANATSLSGWLFIGLIGFTYKAGLHAIWLIVGMVVGDLFISFFVHKKMRIVAEQRKSLSFGEVVSRWHGADNKHLRILMGIITIFFLGIYAAAQFTAGSKALQVLLGWDYSIGAIIGSIIVLLYCLAGGIRASIWTDAIQGCVMLFSMSLLLISAILESGGIVVFIQQLNEVSPTYMCLFPQDHILGVSLFILGWLLIGVGIIGQPHIMTRFLTLNKPELFNRVRWHYYSFYSILGLLTIGVGLSARLLIPNMLALDPELALPTMATHILPQVFVGLTLAGLFAATMSTADSQILSCTAVLARDIFPERLNTYFLVKLSTFFVTLMALLIALWGSKSVFNLVIIAFSALGAAFSPLLILQVFNVKIKENIAIAMVLTGLLVCIIWQLMGFSTLIVEIAPGMIAGFAVYYLSTKLSLT